MRFRDESEAGPGVREAVAPARAVLALEERMQRGAALAKGDPRDVPVSVAAQDHAGQGEKIVRGAQPESLQLLAVARVDFHERHHDAFRSCPRASNFVAAANTVSGVRSFMQ